MTQTIEQLTARVRELEEENARLIGRPMPLSTWQKMEQQLAASKLHAEQLREALETLNKVSNIGCDRVEKALALPSDTSALDAYVANQREAAYQEARRAAAQFEAELTRQRDLAVEALGKRPAFPCSASDHEAWVDSLYAALSTIKESEAK